MSPVTLARKSNSGLSAPGGQLVQETDFFAPVRGARIVLSDDLGARAEMTASWLAQMAWDVYVVESAVDERVSGQTPQALPPRSTRAATSARMKAR